MRPDPRCPSCDGKVSATADWCMHCGREFDAPVDANDDTDGGRVRGGRRAESGSNGSRRDDDSGRVGSSRDDEGSGLLDALERRTGGGGGTTTTTRDESARGRRDGSADAASTRGGAGRERPGPTGGVENETPGAVVDAVVDYVAADEDRRELLAVGVPGALWLTSGETAGAPVAIVGAAILALYLYTRETARETVAASAYGAGVVLAAIQVGRAVALRTRAGRPMAETLAGATGLVAVAAGLVAVGLWIRARGR